MNICQRQSTGEQRINQRINRQLSITITRRYSTQMLSQAAQCCQAHEQNFIPIDLQGQGHQVDNA